MKYVDLYLSKVLKDKNYEGMLKENWKAHTENENIVHAHGLEELILLNICSTSSTI